MTARQVYEAVLVEMNKVQAPSLLLEDFNYLFNKAINQYINKRYNIYDINQQTTDDLRVLKSSVTLRALNDKSPVTDVTVRDSMYGAIYEFSLPQDYLHLLNCICNYKVNKPFKCYNANTYVQFPAQRLTSDMWSQIINNFYMRPTYKRPYYFIHNVNTSIGQGDTWNSQKPTAWVPGQKTSFNGDFGRVPNSRINLPTDPGNIDIQHLEGVGINSKYNDQYVDDTNHYGSNRKYGIDRVFKFSNYNIDSTGGNWLRTGKAILRGDAVTPRRYRNENGQIVEDSMINKQLIYFYFNPNIQGDSEVNFSVSFTGHNAGTGELYTKNKTLIDNIVGSTASVPAPSVSGTFTSNWKTITRIGTGTSDDELTDVVFQNLEILYEWESASNSTVFDEVERVGEVRYGNPSTVRLEIRYGKDNSLFTLDSVYVDYIKAPQHIRITQEQLDLTEDTSQIMEFPDYVIQEIINELVHIVMENSSDPRLQSHVPISQSIANPAQQQEAPQQSRRG